MYKLTKSAGDSNSDRGKLQSALFQARQLQNQASQQSQAAVSQVQRLREQIVMAEAEKHKHGAAADGAMEVWKPELKKEMEVLAERERQDESKRAYQKSEHIALQVVCCRLILPLLASADHCFLEICRIKGFGTR